MTSRKSERSKNPAVSLNPRIQSLFHHIEGDEPKFHRRLEKIHTNPAIYLVRNFLSPVDLDYLDRNITQHASKFKASYTEDENGNKCVSEERTSTYIFLDKGRDTTIRNLEMRASDLVSLSSDFVEPLQIVSYTDGQKFDIHHDAGTLTDEGVIEIVQPRRLVTLFLYLNNLPKGQGCTEFPALNLRITPERGCGILFCNVMPNGDADPRTVHRACPVDPGLRKYGMNVWMTESSMLHMQTQGTVGGQLVSRKDFEAAKASSALSVAEAMTRTFDTEEEKKEEEEKKAGTRAGQDMDRGQAAAGGAIDEAVMTTVVVRAPHTVQQWISDADQHECIGHSLASEFNRVLEEAESPADEEFPSLPLTSSSSSSSSLLPPEAGVGGEVEGMRADTVSPSASASSQVFEGKVTRFAPPSSPLEEALYETVWSDGATLYCGEQAYRTARALYQKVQAETAAAATTTAVSVIADTVTGSAAAVTEEGNGAIPVGEAEAAVEVGQDIMMSEVKTECGLDVDCEANMNVLQEVAVKEEESRKRKIDEVHGSVVIPEVALAIREEGGMELEESGKGGEEEEEGSESDSDDGREQDIRGGEGEAGHVGGDEAEAKRAKAEQAPALVPVLTRSKYCVPYETVLKWRGKKGVDLDYLLGCGLAATPAQQARAVDVLNISGKLICILCNQTISGTRKSLQKHQLTKRHMALHTEVFYGGRNYPTADYAMDIDMPPPSEPVVYAPYSVMYTHIRPSLAACPAPSSSLVSADSAPADSRASGGGPMKSTPSSSSSAKSGYVVDASTMATSLEAMKSWRDKRSINVDYVLGCSETATIEEQERAQKILLCTSKCICILCNQTVAANKKSLRRHQRESKRHASMSEDIEAGTRAFPSSDAAMSMPMPPPAISHSASNPSEDAEGAGAEEGEHPAPPSIPAARSSSAVNSFSVTMPCALAWKKRTGLDTEYLLGICETATLEERVRAEALLVSSGKLICILCNQILAGNRKSVYKHVLTKKHVGQCADVKAGLKPYPTTKTAMRMEVPYPLEQDDLLPHLLMASPAPLEIAHTQTLPPSEDAGPEFFAYSAACVAVEDSDSEAEEV